METTIWNFGKDIFDGGLLYFAIRSVLILLLAKLIARAGYRAFNQYEKKSETSDMTIRFIRKVLKAAVYIIAVFIILDSIKPLVGIGTAVLGATSIISVIVGLAAQESFGNVIAGFFLAMNHPFEVGDFVYIQEQNIKGRVIQITFRQTEIQTPENTKVIIPNSLMNSTIVEKKEYGQKLYTQYMSFDISYESDYEKAKSLIYESVMSTEGVVDTRSKKEKESDADPFVIRIDDYDSNGLKLVFPLNCKKYTESFPVASEVRRKLLKSFKDNKIEVPYTTIQVINKKG